MHPIEKLKAIQEEIAHIKSVIIEMIAHLPDNPNIQRLKDNCFTIESGELMVHGNWTVFYHDWKAQAKLLINVIEDMTDPFAIPLLVQHTIEKRTIKHHGNLYKFHPQFIEQLKTRLIYH